MTYLWALLLGLNVAVFDAHSVQAAEYFHQDITANTAPTRYCYPITKAKDLTADDYNLDRFNKRFCSRLGEGWQVDKLKSRGTPVCIPCTDTQVGTHQCYMQNVVVSCKLIKPSPSPRGAKVQQKPTD